MGLRANVADAARAHEATGVSEVGLIVVDELLRAGAPVSAHSPGRAPKKRCATGASWRQRAAGGPCAERFKFLACMTPISWRILMAGVQTASPQYLSRG